MTRDPFLQAAIDEARLGLNEGGIPIGSVLVHKGPILGRGQYLRVQLGDPLLHGEKSTFKHAGRQPAHVHRECVLYTTLSPCPMCSGTALLYKFRASSSPRTSMVLLVPPVGGGWEAMAAVLKATPTRKQLR